MVVVRTLHGIKFHDLPGAEYRIKENDEEFVLKTHRTFTEILHRYRSELGKNEVLYVVDGVNNPKLALEYVRKTRRLVWGDDFLVVKYRGGKIDGYIRISCPPWFLEMVDPRDRKSWDEIASKCRVSYNDEVDYEDVVRDCEFYEDREACRRAEEIEEFARKYGDDLTNYVVRKQREELRRPTESRSWRWWCALRDVRS